MFPSLACPTSTIARIMTSGFYGVILLLGLPRPTPSPQVPGYRANIEAPLIMAGEYGIIDFDKSKISSPKDLRMDVEAGRQKDSRYIGLNFEHADGNTYDVQNVSPVIPPHYAKPLSGDLRRRCWKVRRTRQFYHLANPVGQMNTVSEAFPRDLSHAALGTTLVCQVDDNTISLGLCKVLGFCEAEYEESDYIFVILKRWNALPLTEHNGHYRAPVSAHLLDEEESHYRALLSAHLLDEEEGNRRALLSAHLLGPLMPLEPLVPQYEDEDISKKFNEYVSDYEPTELHIIQLSRRLRFKRGYSNRQVLDEVTKEQEYREELLV
ncbi:hypothetical protein FOZ61_003088 [Perkinsus olseni]|uniref:Uncharacterized protein n=1 Tax=Perkinsus olseni TaxID=32597 RepID=A0A7J6LQT3_PEROL|nr:hypothetical protein FOZ61_003088 [Perkinsus olseni]KAF4667025.1 hypothetical protein FOL46_002747 [Perkinsus olseni]